MDEKISGKDANQKRNPCCVDCATFLSMTQNTINRLSSTSALFKTLFGSFSSIVATIAITAFVSNLSKSSLVCCSSVDSCECRESVTGFSFQNASELMIVFLVFLFLITVLFSLFDAHYLSLERGYVNVYKRISNYCLNGGNGSFDWDYSPITQEMVRKNKKRMESVNYQKESWFLKERKDPVKRTSLLACLRSWSILPFYLGIFFFCGGAIFATFLLLYVF